MYHPIVKQLVKRSLFSTAVVMFLLLAACDRGSRPPRIGQPAPDFTVQDSSRKVSLASLRGKIVVLNFWATWCPPCVEEMPSLVEMQSRMKDRGVTVLAVSLDKDESAYTKFIAENRINLLTVRDAQEKSNSLYGTYKYPETYIIDRQGVVRRKFIGPVDWRDPEILDYLEKL